jgi:hypothetical protein
VAALSKGPFDSAQGRPFDGAQGRPNRILGYVENMSGYYCRDCNAIKPLFPPSRERFGPSTSSGPSRATSRDGEAGSSTEPSTLEIPCLGTVPFDPELARHCDLGIPLEELPNTPVGRALDHLAQRLLESLP